MITKCMIQIIKWIFPKKWGEKLIPICEASEEAIEYLFWGGVAFLLSMVLYWVFVNPCNMVDWFANIVDWVICVLFTYVTNRVLVFKSSVTGAKERCKEFFEFVSARLFTLGLEEVVILIGGTLLGFQTGLGGMVVKLIGQVIVIVSNYFLSKLWIFKEKEEA